MRYLITFTCYGTDVHGNGPLSVDAGHNLPGSRFVDVDTRKADIARQRMDQKSYLLDCDRRVAVLHAIQETCDFRHWTLWAAHVRTTHVHVVAEAEVRPESMMNAFKSYASRKLNQLGFDSPERKRWTKHGRTLWLWNDTIVSRAMGYVVYEQGEQMAVFLGETERRSLTVTAPSEESDSIAVL